MRDFHSAHFVRTVASLAEAILMVDSYWFAIPIRDWLAIWEGCLDWARWGWRESNDSSSVASWSRMSIAYLSVSLFKRVQE